MPGKAVQYLNPDFSELSSPGFSSPGFPGPERSGLEPCRAGSNLRNFSLARQADLLQQLAQQVLCHRTVPELLGAIAQTLAHKLAAPDYRCWQVLSDGTSLGLVAVSPGLAQAPPPAHQACPGALPVLSPRLTPASHPWVEQLLGLDQPLPFSDRRASSWKQLLCPSHPAQAGLLLPVRDEENRSIALLELYSAPSEGFAAESLAFLPSVGQLLATAIQRSRFEALLSSQSQVLAQLATGSTIDQLFDSLCLLMEEISPGGLCSIMLLDESGTKMLAGAAPNFPRTWTQAVDGLAIGEGMASCGTALYRREPVFVEDIATDPLWAQFRDFAGAHNIHSCWSTPFFSQSGEVLGTFAISHRQRCLPRHHHHQLIKTAAHLASIATENRRAAARLWHQAHRDALTGLPNRTTLMERIEQCLAGAEPFALLFLDVDHFKLVNDSWGHSVGDRLLVAIARRLEAQLGPADLLARLGGDEFVILHHGCAQPAEAEELARRLGAQFQQPFELGELELFSTLTVGIACRRDRDTDPEALLRDADIAMYWAKQNPGGDRLALFDQAMHERVLARHHLETGLRQAIQEIRTLRGANCADTTDAAAAGLQGHQLALHYQPIVKLETGEIVGFEALLRWCHPEQGNISPAQFIPVAEETGLIVPLGQWVLEQAWEQLGKWYQQQGPSLLFMSINVSGQQLLQADFVAQVERLLEQGVAPPACLKLEITETVLIEAAAVVKERLEALRSLGVQLSLDDFGTGYSSLSYLHQFPVNTLKIDRAFVKDLQPGQDQVTRAMVALSQGLMLEAIAEGIETEEQRSQLLAMGCEYGQGYLFSRPVDCAGAEALLGCAGLAQA